MLEQGHRGLPNSAKESTVTLLLQGIDSLVGQSGSSLLEGLVAGIEVDEAELEVQGRREGLKDPTAGLYFIKQHSVSEMARILNRERATHRDDLPSDTVSGDKTYKIRSGQSIDEPQDRKTRAIVPMRSVRAAAILIDFFEELLS